MPRSQAAVVRHAVGEVGEAGPQAARRHRPSRAAILVHSPSAATSPSAKDHTAAAAFSGTRLSGHGMAEHLQSRHDATATSVGLPNRLCARRQALAHRSVWRMPAGSSGAPFGARWPSQFSGPYCGRGGVDGDVSP